MFRYRQQLRRWAARVLLLWVFGAGAGIANACLAPNIVGLPAYGSGSSAAPGVLHAEAGTAFNALHHGHGAHQAQNEDTPDPPRPTAGLNCQDFCDKATVSIPPLKSPLDQLQAHALPPSAAPTALAVPALPRVQLWVPRRDGVWAPPIPIAFLRLTL